MYQVEFDSAELIRKCVHALDAHLNVAALQYVVGAREQKVEWLKEDLAVSRVRGHEDGVRPSRQAGSQVKYDLLGEIAEKTSSPAALRSRSCAGSSRGRSRSSGRTPSSSSPRLRASSTSRRRHGDRRDRLRHARRALRLRHLHREPDEATSKGRRQAQEERLRVRRDRLEGRATSCGSST